MQLRPALARNQGAEVDGLLNQVLVSFPSDKVRASVEKLRSALQTEREEKENSLVEKIEAIMARTIKAVETARAPADLDNAIRELSSVPEQREAISEKTRVLVERIRNARQFTICWQDYLDYMAAGRSDLAKKSLEEANRVSAANILPRSAVLSRLAEFKDPKKEESETSPLPRLREIMAKAKSLADLPAAIEAVSDFRSASGKAASYDNPMTALYNELISIQHCYEDFRGGLPTLLQLEPANSYPHHGEAIQLAFPLKLELMRLVFPRFLRVDRVPTKDEPIDDYVARMMQFALEQGDPRLILRVYELRNAINATYQSAQLSPGLDALLAARNQEDAGQFVPAVISYQKALRLGGELVPAKAIGARLDAIKASHPAEYEAGMKLYLAKPDPAPPMIQGSIQAYSLQVPSADANPEPVPPRLSPTPP
ncbi:MAG: hypothetical protein DME97_02595 [Verrucomicrobia bacterium]|nr:MAG: hypothetical protein DME97_02595 [Verrucomicrobiota bacterium]